MHHNFAGKQQVVGRAFFYDVFVSPGGSVRDVHNHYVPALDKLCRHWSKDICCKVMLIKMFFSFLFPF